MRAILLGTTLGLLLSGCVTVSTCEITNATDEAVTITGFSNAVDSRKVAHIRPGRKLRVVGDGVRGHIEVSTPSGGSLRYGLKRPPGECFTPTGWWLFTRWVYLAELRRDGTVLVRCPGGSAQFIVEPEGAKEPGRNTQEDGSRK
jgi:hypothetical protein